MIKQILAQIRTPAPAGCSTPQFGEALENFFLTMSAHSKRRYAVSFRQFAEFRELPRSHWPGALETFLALPEAQAKQLNERYLAWLNANKLGWNRPSGRRGTGLVPISRHLHSRGLTSWSLPRYCDLRSQRVWEACEPTFRIKVAEYLENLKVRNFTPRSLQRAAINLRVLGRHLKEKQQSYLEMNYDRALDYVRAVLERKDWGEFHRHSIIWHARAFYKWLKRAR